MITVKVNNTSKTFSKDTTVVAMIDDLQIQSNGIAIAINNTIITKSEWENYKLSDNDTILIIRSTQGG